MSSTPQHMAALDYANEVRLARCDVKRKIFKGRMLIAEALEEECVASMEIEALLRAQFRWGQLRARKLLRALEISPTRRVDELTGRQRTALAQVCGTRS